MNKLKSRQGSLPSARIQAGGHIILLFEVLFYWAAHTALVVSTAYYLWGVDEESTYGECKACDDKYEYVENVSVSTCDSIADDHIIDVQKRFSDILKIYFAFFITQWVRDTVLIIACIAKSPKIARFFECIGCF